MIERGTHRQAAKALRQMPRKTRRQLEARIESPKPGKKLGFLGQEVVIDRIEVSVNNDPDGNYVFPQIVTHALAEAGVIRMDKGRGGKKGADVPLQFDGSNCGPDGRRTLIFGPFGANILQAGLHGGIDSPPTGLASA